MASLLLVDSPAGYSYAENENEYITNDTMSSGLVWFALKGQSCLLSPIYSNTMSFSYSDDEVVPYPSGSLNILNFCQILST